jgi:site-specific recombinase
MLNDNEQLDYYSFFTRYSLMEDYGFTAGLFSRVFRKLLPRVPQAGTIEYFLIKNDHSVDAALDLLDFDTIASGVIARDLDLSIKALCAKISAFGLDRDIKAKFNLVDLDPGPFELLLAKLTALPTPDATESEALVAALNAIEYSMTSFRKRKSRIGTSLHLTIVTKRILEYVDRVRELLALKINITSKSHWAAAFTSHRTYSAQKDSLRRYIVRHIDLLALEIVEYTSGKGEKYVAENKQEFLGFFYKSLLGGAIISVFALLKIVLDSYGLSPFGNAFWFSVNYALCFIMVKQFGGIIATKQPAMTASTIAKNIDKSQDLRVDSIPEVIRLIRSVFRSQFISVVGNFLMAISCACLISFLLQQLAFDELISMIKPDYLIKNAIPSDKLLAFAAIAGCFLALSGLIAGYFDNRVAVANIGHRIRNSRLFFRSEMLATFVEKKAGALIGNISLGFLLGSAFLLGWLLPFAIDIRHIAFSSANVGYAAMNKSFDYTTILLALAGVLLIGFTNFIVSFSITLLLTLKSRGATFRILPQLLSSVLRDFIRRPLGYFFFQAEGIPEAIKPPGK